MGILSKDSLKKASPLHRRLLSDKFSNLRRHAPIGLLGRQDLGDMGLLVVELRGSVEGVPHPHILYCYCLYLLSWVEGIMIICLRFLIIYTFASPALAFHAAAC